MQHRPCNQTAGNMINNLSELTQVAGMSPKKSSAILGSFSWQLQDKLITAFQSFLKNCQNHALFGDPRIFFFLFSWMFIIKGFFVFKFSPEICRKSWNEERQEIQNVAVTDKRQLYGWQLKHKLVQAIVLHKYTN